MTGAISLKSSIKPTFIVLYLSGLYSLPTRTTGRCCKALNTVGNIFIPVVYCTCLGLRLTSEVRHFSTTGTTIASLYLTIFEIGAALLCLCFRFRCQKYVKIFFVELEAYKSKRCKKEMSYRSVFIIGMGAVCFLVFKVGISLFSALRPTGVTVACPTHQSSWSDFVFTVCCNSVFTACAGFAMSQIYSSSLWMYACVWRLLQQEANDIVTSLTEQDKSDLTQRPETIEEIRQRHADLCNLIVLANRFICYILATIYGTGVPCILLILHGIVYRQIPFDDYVAMVIFFPFFVFDLIAVTLSAVALHLKMHEPMDYLFQLDVQKMSGRGMDSVSTFLARVQGSSIGFNVFNLFTVDTSAIMMICGTVLTYALVIIQFQPGLTGHHPASQEGKPPTLAALDDTPAAVANTTGI